MSWMSRSRQALPLSRYWLSPERKSLRVTTISRGRSTAGASTLLECSAPLVVPFASWPAPLPALLLAPWVAPLVPFPIPPLAVPLVPSAVPLILICPADFGERPGRTTPSGSYNVMLTCASPDGLRSREPPKMNSCIRAPRNVFADCSPNTQLIASLMLDFPQPFGPTIAATPSPVKRNSWRSENDLKPTSSSFFKCSKTETFSSRRRVARSTTPTIRLLQNHRPKPGFLEPV